MSHYKAIIFDLDNTILDRTQTFLTFSRSFINNYFENHDQHDNLLKRLIELDQDGYKDKKVLFDELLAELPWEIKPDHSELMNYYDIHYVKSAVLMDQAIEVIQALRSKYKIGMITNGRTMIQYGKIDFLKIRNHFDAIIVSEEAGIKKPHVDIFELAAARLGIPLDQCMYIGDHPLNDIVGAAKAGMDTIWFQVNQPWSDSITVIPKQTITHLNELLDYL
ncbi:HAD family hydrolase [Paenibacillus sp. L3-i20]|uniref:HAD family hydrolase n=1 Tax=Paenibacillus sp. L3-i20 TaxID=2905833 RepID=UPI001EE082D0|nr:HAD family hydrolase [Paenibacillus sp. L3-i20]GKU79166.1 haloacid dehalogenase [Paenibacillus sp. L3-i20]